MSRELHAQDAIFRASLARCDQAAGPVEGRRLSQIIDGRPMVESAGFDRQIESAPALLAIVWSLAQSLFARGIRPDLLLGYSLGETIAATVAGVLTLEDAFSLIVENARSFEALLAPAAMLAVLAPASRVMALPAVAAADAELAAVNSPQHCVLTLPQAGLAGLTAALGAEGLVIAALPVRCGFHASLLDPAEGAVRAARSASRQRSARWLAKAGRCPSSRPAPPARLSPSPARCWARRPWRCRRSTSSAMTCAAWPSPSRRSMRWRRRATWRGSRTAAAPDFVAGHSLGGYAALFAAEAFDFATGLRLVQKRGALMGAVSGGGMMAALGLPLERLRDLLAADPALSAVDLSPTRSSSRSAPARC